MILQATPKPKFGDWLRIAIEMRVGVRDLNGDGDREHD